MIDVIAIRRGLRPPTACRASRASAGKVALRLSTRKNIALGLHGGHGTLAARRISDPHAAHQDRFRRSARHVSEMMATLAWSVARRAVPAIWGCRRADHAIRMVSALNALSAQVAAWAGPMVAMVGLARALDWMRGQACAHGVRARQAASRAGGEVRPAADCTRAIAMARWLV